MLRVHGKVTDIELAPLLCVWKSIQTLQFNDLNITSASLYIIANICSINLKCLCMDCIDICDHGLSALTGKCPELQAIFIDKCNRVTAKGLVALVLTTPKLIQLHVHISTLTDADITTIAQHCPMLYTLALDANLITDLCIQSIVSHCSQLHSLYLLNCTAISTGFSLYTEPSRNSSAIKQV